MRFESRNVGAIKAAAVAKLGRPLDTREDFHGLTLKDSRSPSERTAAGMRKPVPVPGDGPQAVEIKRLEAKLRAEKLMKMSDDARRLFILRELRDREVEQATGEHPRIESILRIRDGIRFDPDREQADAEFASLVLAQHAEGMDPDVASQLYDELIAREGGYIDSVEAAVNVERAALESRLAGLNTSRAALPPSDPKKLRLLAAAVQRGRAPAEALDAVTAAEASGDAAEAAIVLTKYAAPLAAYEAAVQSGEVQ